MGTACALMYRGEILPKDVTAATRTSIARRDIRFVDWCPSCIKCGINYHSAPAVPGWPIPRAKRSVVLLGSNTCIGECFSVAARRFDKLYSQRAFVHNFTSEGMDEGEFGEARENIATLEKDY